MKIVATHYSTQRWKVKIIFPGVASQLQIELPWRRSFRKITSFMVRPIMSGKAVLSRDESTLCSNQETWFLAITKDDEITGAKNKDNSTELSCTCTSLKLKRKIVHPAVKPLILQAMIYQGSQQSIENILETSRFLAELVIKPLLCPHQLHYLRGEY